MVIMTLSIGTRNAIYDSSLHSSLENKVKTSSGEGLSDVLLLWSYNRFDVQILQVLSGNPLLQWAKQKQN